MEFCSKYGYDYGFNGSDEETIDDEDIQTNAKVKRKIRKADTNIIAVKFDKLVFANNTFAGDPIKCSNCEAILIGLSKPNISNKNIWSCDFCFHENDLNETLKTFGLDQIPSDDDVTFLIEPAPQIPSNQNQNKDESLNDDMLMFCIDVSGSMDTAVLDNDKNSKQTQFLSFERASSQLTRLEAVKLASIENIRNLKKEEPNKKVGLVTFSDSIKFYADGMSLPQNKSFIEIGGYSHHYNVPFMHHQMFAPQIAQQQYQMPQQYQIPIQQPSQISIQPDAQPDYEDYLNDKEKMLEFAKNQDVFFQGIKNTGERLEQLIKNLRTEGSTALGPGLVFSIGFLSKRSGSQVILCTDGCANVGMGSVELVDTKQADKFYEDLAKYAKEKGITVNVISMEGTDCKLALLGKVADGTNGTMHIVNPKKLGDQFKSILQNRIVATNVTAKLIVNNKYLYIRDEDLEASEAKAIENNDLKAKEALNETKRSVVTKDIGNANVDTEITFEYGLRKLKTNEKTRLQSLPFQLQITYTANDGSKALRVYNKKQEFTSDRKMAEVNLFSDEILWSNAAQRMSYQLLSSNVSSAKYKVAQMSAFSNMMQCAPPSAYTKKANIVERFDKNKPITEMADYEAEEMYEGKKASRFLFKDNKQKEAEEEE